MTDKQLPSHVRPIAGSLEALNSRLYELERRTAPSFQTRLMPAQFSYPGDLAVNIESPPWYTQHAVQLTAVRLAVTQAASGDIIIELRIDGSPIQQVTLPTGQLTYQQGINIEMTYANYLTVKTISNGGDGANLSIGFSPLYI